jgi:nitrogen regulatory protein PII-like uncharacterized protein
MWDVWPLDIHKHDEQIKRQKSAADETLTPIYIDTKEQYGVFKGSKNNYYTTLVNCECVDFIRRKKPCKHMYRLSSELGVFSLTFSPKKIKNFDFTLDKNKILQCIKDLSTEALFLLKSILYLEIYHPQNLPLFTLNKKAAEELISSKLIIQIEADTLEKLNHATKHDLLALLNNEERNIFPKRAHGKTILKYIRDHKHDYLNNKKSELFLLRFNENLKKSARTIYREISRQFEETGLCINCFNKIHNTSLKNGQYTSSEIGYCNHCEKIIDTIMLRKPYSHDEPSRNTEIIIKFDTKNN